MTLEELLGLFPIVLTPHNPLWADWAGEEMKSLSGLLAEYHPVINHIGSTAIPEIQAKPIIDILIEVSTDVDWHLIKNIMGKNGYLCMSEMETRISFNKGYTPEGYADKIFHIHFHRIADNDEILFRDYLMAHPDVAREYEQLKRSLLPKYKNDRDGYTEAKSGFIRSIVNAARKF